MTSRFYALKEAERIVPLLRSIGREIQARRQASGDIQQRIELLRATPARPGVAATGLESELATHLREIRSAEKELERLGCRLDEQHPLRILIPSGNGDWAFDGSLDDTRFYATPARGAS